MKIKVVNNDKVGNNFVKVLFSDKIANNRFIFKDGQDILEMKISERKNMTRRKWIIFVREIIQEAKKNRIKNILINWDDLTNFNDIGGGLGRLFSENAEMANYEFRKYRKKPKDGWADVLEIGLETNGNSNKKLQDEINKGLLISRQVNYCRDLSNTPGDDMTPDILSREAKKIALAGKISCNVLNEKEIAKEKMGGVLAVAKGSQCKPKFIVMEYLGGTKSDKPIVLIGKGVTFDSGGIDTKPHPYALDMMMDMSGGSAVIGTISIAAQLKLKKNIIALVPAVENMPSGTSFRPGDIVRMMDGTTVEVRHTDAEGRLILADALTYARRYKPKMVIDVATLTGAALTALGERANAIFSDDDDLIRKTEKIAEEVGDYVWRLPLWDEYKNDIKGDFGEISNINTKAKPGYGGSITAAIFLKHFASGFEKWMHIDIAPRMTAVYDENLSKGATGTPIKLLVRLLEDE